MKDRTMLIFLLIFLALVCIGLSIYISHNIATPTLSGEKIATDTDGVVMITKSAETAWVIFVSHGGRAQPVKASICMEAPKCKALVDSLIAKGHVKVLEVDEPADDEGSQPLPEPEAHPKAAPGDTI